MKLATHFHIMLSEIITLLPLYIFTVWRGTTLPLQWLIVLNDTMLKRMSGTTKKDISQWKKLHEIHDLYCTSNITKVINSRRRRCGGCVSNMEEKRNTCRIMVGKPKQKRPFGKTSCRKD
jgi:hypothetical protein